MTKKNRRVSRKNLRENTIKVPEASNHPEQIPRGTIGHANSEVETSECVLPAESETTPLHGKRPQREQPNHIGYSRRKKERIYSSFRRQYAYLLEVSRKKMKPVSFLNKHLVNITLDPEYLRRLEKDISLTKKPVTKIYIKKDVYTQILRKNLKELRVQRNAFKDQKIVLKKPKGTNSKSQTTTPVDEKPRFNFCLENAHKPMLKIRVIASPEMIAEFLAKSSQNNEIYSQDSHLKLSRPKSSDQGIDCSVFGANTYQSSGDSDRIRLTVAKDTFTQLKSSQDSFIHMSSFEHKPIKVDVSPDVVEITTRKKRSIPKAIFPLPIQQKRERILVFDSRNAEGTEKILAKGSIKKLLQRYRHSRRRERNDLGDENTIQLTTSLRPTSPKTNYNNEAFSYASNFETTQNLDKMPEQTEQKDQPSANNDLGLRMLTCCSCLGRFFHEETKKLNDKVVSRFPGDRPQRMHTESSVCLSCFYYISRGKEPKLFCKESMMFPVLFPAVRDLNDFESALVCPRIPFMKMRNEVNPGKQYSLIGNVNNIEIDLCHSIKTLIDLSNKKSSFFVRLKRKSEFQRAYMAGDVDLQKIINAINSLIQTDLYKNEFEDIDLQRLAKLEKDLRNLPRTSRVVHKNEEFVLADFAYESVDIVPAENGWYRDIILDANGEFLTFPKIYSGKVLDYSHLSYPKQCLSEFRREDPRARKSIHKLFFSYMKFVALKIQNDINLLVSKKSFIANHPSGWFLSKDNLKKGIEKKDINKVLRSVPSSPAFWRERKKLLIEMIKQIGPPSFFITLSPEENKDLMLLSFLALEKNILKENVSVGSLDKGERNKLIAEDPINTVRYTHRKFKKIIDKVILSRDGVFRDNPVVEYFYRVEFQERGSPHIHMLIWCQDLDTVAMSDQDLCILAEKYISVDAGNDFSFKSADGTAIDLKTQVHKHMKNCKRSVGDESYRCSKKFPKPVLDESIVVEPLSMYEKPRPAHKENYKKIWELHENMQRDQQKKQHFPLSQEETLQILNLSKEEYVSALQYAVTVRTVYLKRRSESIMINNYNKEIMEVHRSNMDIQLITDPYGLANYVASYMMKSNFEKIQLLREIEEEIRTSNLSLKKQLMLLKTKYQNITKVSAQECAWTLLGLDFSVCSRKSVYINTRKSKDRSLRLKTRKELLRLPQNSTDIFLKEMQYWYSVRPTALETICFADFCSSYTWRASPKEYCQSESLKQNQIRIDHNRIVDFKHQNKGKIISLRKIKCEKNPTDFFMHQIKLYLPWRSEVEQTENINHLQVYQENIGEITVNEIKYKHHISGDFEQALVDAQERLKVLSEIRVAKATYDNVEDEEEDLGFECPLEQSVQTAWRKDQREQGRVIHEIAEMDQYEVIGLFQSLNASQHAYLEKFTESFRAKSPFYHIIVGGAGTGKSFLIRAIVQKFKLLRKTQQETIVLAAQTGKAAFHISGCTIHTAFGIPLNSSKLMPLSVKSLKEFQKSFQGVRLIVIDEVSLVGETLLTYINFRLKQIFATNQEFGGVSIILVGDFNQLRPVKDSWIFGCSSEDSLRQYRVFRYWMLEQSMRQREDDEWANILNKIAKHYFYSLASHEIQLLESRIVPVAQIPKEAIFLGYSNAEVSELNAQKISAMDGTTIISEAVDTISGKDSDTLRANRTLQTIKRSTSYMDTGCLPSLLKMKVGAKYMLTRNLDVSDGLVNGAVGICKKFILSENENLPVVKRVYLDFMTDQVGRRMKQTSEYRESCAADDIEPGLSIPINCDSVVIFREKGGRDCQIKRLQLPIIECEAITIHKSQGQTYQSIALNICKPLTKQLLYVALSRVPKLSNLYLYNSLYLVPGPIKIMTTEEKQHAMSIIDNTDPVALELKRVRDENNSI